MPINIEDDIDEQLEKHELVQLYVVTSNRQCLVCGTDLEQSYDYRGKENGFKAHQSLANCVKALSREIEELRSQLRHSDYRNDI